MSQYKITVQNLTEKEYTEDSHYDIVIDTSSSPETAAHARALLASIGKVQKVVHQRSKVKVDYSTVIITSKAKVFIKGGLTSGYVGGGTSATASVLSDLGVTSSDIDTYFRDNSSENEIITITF